MPVLPFFIKYKGSKRICLFGLQFFRLREIVHDELHLQVLLNNEILDSMRFYQGDTINDQTFGAVLAGVGIFCIYEARGWNVVVLK